MPRADFPSRVVTNRFPAKLVIQILSSAEQMTGASVVILISMRISSEIIAKDAIILIDGLMKPGFGYHIQKHNIPLPGYMHLLIAGNAMKPEDISTFLSLVTAAITTPIQVRITQITWLLDSVLIVRHATGIIVLDGVRQSIIILGYMNVSSAMNLII